MGTRLATSEDPRAYSVIVYNKGGLVLNMLRSLMHDPRGQTPDARFSAMMRDFCQTFENKPASTEDFKAIAEKHMTPLMDLEQNRRLDWFFRQYVYGTGIPEYQFRYKVADESQGKWKVSGVLTPRKVSPGWRDLLRLYAQTGNRVFRLAWLEGSAKEMPFEFELPFKPDKLTVNLNEDTLADVAQ